jgi:hypothetical protein
MRISKKPMLLISDADFKELQKLSVSRTASHRTVIRANIFLKYHQGKTITQISREMNTNRPLVERCVNKGLAWGVLAGLKDLPGRGAKPVITDDAKSWVLSIACSKPTDYGYPYETWTYSLLKFRIRNHCVESGFECLQKIDRGSFERDFIQRRHQAA